MWLVGLTRIVQLGRGHAGVRRRVLWGIVWLLGLVAIRLAGGWVRRCVGGEPPRGWGGGTRAETGRGLVGELGAAWST